MVSYRVEYGFKIRSLADARHFCEELFLLGSTDFPDVNDPKYYYSIARHARDGKLRFGHARYGEDPILAEPVLMREDNLPELIYKARKSINAHFYKN